MDRDPLANEFPAANEETWSRLATEVLRGAAVDSLVRTTRDGIPIRPLYTRAAAEHLGRAAGVPGAAPFVRGADAAGNSGGWDVRVRQAHPDPGHANQRLLQDLEHGASSATLVTATGPSLDDGAPDGIVVLDLADLDRTLAGVRLDLAPVALEAGGRFAQAGALLLALLEQRGLDPGDVRAALNADPLGAALTGTAPDPSEGLASAVEMTRHGADRWPGITALLADGRPWHAAGAAEAQELAATIATALDYLRALDAGGLPLDRAAGQIAFALAADADFFLTVAKMRALRRLWARVLAVCGVPDAATGMRLHAETAMSMHTRRDSWVNVLRGTVACFAAAAGGANSVTVLPFDHALGPPGPLARRLARNTQLILMEESNLHRVIDPAGGAWYVETLTDELARKAWELLQGIEAVGGMLAACRAGMPQAWVAATWAERARDLATRREPITGVSEFPDLNERPIEPETFDTAALVARARERLAAAEVSQGFSALLRAAKAGRALTAPAETAGLSRLPRHRLGEAFESLRDRGDRAQARDGRRPRVFLVTLGSPAQHTARANFARNLFEAGGIEPVAAGPLASAETVAEAFRESGTRVAALCSSDEVYAELAVPAARALRADGCELIGLFGGPGERRGELEAAGIDLFVQAGDDMIKVLTGLHDRLGTPAARGQESVS